MPATITHAFFAKDVYDILPEEIVQKLDIDRLRMFSQGVDSLMFYNLFSIFPGKEIRRFQGYFHNHTTQEFFVTLLKYIKDNNIDDIDTYTFLVGFICHYALDSTIHPYVVYKTGRFNKKNPSTYKYNNVHAFMEAYIDNDMVRRRLKRNPYSFNFTKFCFDTKPFSSSLDKTIDYTFSHTFNRQDMSKIYYKSLKQMKWSLRIFRKDRFGVKKFIYQLVDTFTPRRCYRFEAISYHYPLKDYHNYLNNDHTLWRNPCIYDMTSTESFIDLYLKAIQFAKELTYKSFDYLNNENINLKKVFTNISYVTGLDCDSNKQAQYFEF
ncbi:MAG: zinc dependent phospholipase C family protein [Bacilli bacterium]|nr:zinc dependent phospholipase C family protein [Bacilli bacterium]